MKNEKHRVHRKWKKILMGILIFAGCLGLSFLIVVKVFTVQKVVVDGNKLYSDEQIREWVLNDEYSWNSLYVFLKYRFMETEEVPFIDTMEVTMSPPHTINIEVYEKGMLGYLYIESLGQNIYFDKDGFVVEMSADTIEDVAQIKGLSCSKVVLYEKLKLDQDGVLKKLLAMTNMLKKFELAADDITYESGGTFTLAFGDVTVLMGDNVNLEEKVTRLQVILPQLEGMTGTLHMENWSENNTDISFDKTGE